MPRTARASGANLCYHVLNRGNNRARIFQKTVISTRLSTSWPKRSCGTLGATFRAWAYSLGQRERTEIREVPSLSTALT